MRFGRFLRELHRRSVWQVLATYGVVAWIILQLAEILEGLVGLPLWFGPAVVVILLLGFPVLLTTTIAQGGWRRGGFGDTAFADSAEGGDPSLSSWRSLERKPLRDALRRVFTWRNALAGGALMGLLLMLGTAGYTGLRSSGVGPVGSLVAKGVLESNEKLILSDFDDRTFDGTLGETVTALFRIDLEQSTSIHLMDRRDLSPAMVRMEKDPGDPLTRDVAMELAQRVGVKAVVTGEILPLGPGVVVSARLVVAGTGEEMAAVRETARTIDEVPDAVDRLSAQLRERIGESLRSIQGDPPLEEVTTASLEALRKYAQAERALDMGEVSVAEALVHEAIALDSSFAMAYRKLGVILANQGGEEEKARQAFIRAYQGRSRLSDRERLLAEAAYHSYVTGEMDSAVLAYRAVLEMFPGDKIAGNNLAVLYGEGDDPDQAVELYLQAIEQGDAPAVTYANAASTLFEMDRTDSARAILLQFRSAHPGHPQALQYSAALASAEFDYTQAAERARELLAGLEVEGRPGMRMWGEAELGRYAMIQGHLNEGNRRLLQAREHGEKGEARMMAMALPLLEAYGTAAVQLYFLEDGEGAARTLELGLAEADWLEIRPEARGHLDFAVLFADAGRPDLARERVAAYRNEVPQEVREKPEWQGTLLLAEGAIARAEGAPAEALELYREGRALLTDCSLCGLVEMGEAFESGAQPDSAVQVYEAYLAGKDMFRSQHDVLKLHRVLLGLGRSYEVLGRPDRALDYLGWQLELWSNVDLGLQSRVEAIRNKVRVLREAQR